MPLAYLEFDFSEDTQGRGSFEAMAAVAPAQWPALQAEVLQVLSWAEAAFGPPGGEGAWDFALDGVEERAVPLRLHWAAGHHALEIERAAAGEPRTTLSLTLSGEPSFCAALRETFGLE